MITNAAFYRSARFLVSANALDQLPADTGREVAFAGRSNAGKSSAINTLVEQKGLARTSKTPGRTQLVNFFSLCDGVRLVDLPGYGYAQVPGAVKQHWQALLATYLESRQCLQGLVLIMDARHPLTDYDRMMLEWCSERHLGVHVLLTKADKLSRGAALNALLKVRRVLEQEFAGTTVQLFSSHTKIGVDEARAALDAWLRPHA